MNIQNNLAKSNTETNAAMDSISNIAAFIANTKDAIGAVSKIAPMLKSNPIFLVAAAVTGIGAAVYKFRDALEITSEEAIERMDAQISKIQNLHTEMDSVRNEIRLTTSRIQELEAKNSLTLIEQDELEKLKEANRQLERTLRISEYEETDEKKKGRQKALNYLNTENEIINTKSENESNYDLLNTKADNLGYVEQMLERYVKYQKEIDIAKKQSEETDDSGKDDKGYDRKYNEYNISMKDISDRILTFQEFDDYLDPVKDEAYLKRLSAIYDMYDRVTDFPTYAKNKMDDVFNEKMFSGVKDKLIEMGQIDELSIGMLTADYGTLVHTLDELGIGVQDLFVYIMDAAGMTGNGNSGAAFSSKSFQEVWNAESFSSSQNELMQLAQAGEINPSVLQSSEEYIRLINDTGLSAEKATLAIMNELSAQEKLSAFEHGITPLTDSWSSIETSGFLMADALEELKNKYGDLASWDVFEKISGDASKSTDEIKDAYESLMFDYIQQQGTLSKVDNSNSQKFIDDFKSIGITNADEIVENAMKFNTVVEDAYKEYSDYINKKGALDADYLNQKETMNAQLESILGETYKNDLDNWKLALEKKSEAYNIFLAAITGAEGATEQEQFQNKLESAVSDSDRANISQKYYNAYKTATEEDTQRKKVQKDIDKINLDLSKIDFNPSSSSYNGNNPKGSSTGAGAKSSDTVIDWISRKLDRLNSKITLTQSKYENLVDTLGKKVPKNSENLLNAQIKNLDKQIKKYKELAKAEGNAAKRYSKKTNKVTISKDKKEDNAIKKAVRDGRIDAKKTPLKELIATYDEDTAKAIQEYQKWYDASKTAKNNRETALASRRKKREEKNQRKADFAQANIDLLQAQAANTTDNYKTQNDYLDKQVKYIKDNYKYQIRIAKLNGNTLLVSKLKAEQENELAQLEKQKFDNIKTEYDNRLGIIKSNVDYLSAQQNLIEANGQVVTSKYYKAQAAYALDRKSKLEAEKAALQEQAKRIKQNTQEWYDMKSVIAEIDTEIVNCNTDVAEMNNRILELSNSIREKLFAGIEATTTELNFLAGLMDNREMYKKDSTELSEAGLAKLGSYTITYYNSIEEKDIAIKNREIYQDIVDNYDKYADADGKVTFTDALGNVVPLNSPAQAKEGLAKATEEAQQYENQIYESAKNLINLQIEGLERELSLVRKLTDSKKKQLSTEKALHDYQKNITKQTQNIDSLQKRIAALSGDDSEEGRARIQKLQKELDDAREELSETEYDKYISDQQEMLDNLYSEYENTIEDLKSDVDTLLNSAIEYSNKHFVDIKKILGNIATGAGYALSDDVKKILEADSAKQGAEQVAAGVKENVVKDNTDDTETANSSGGFFSGVRNLFSSLLSKANKYVSDTPHFAAMQKLLSIDHGTRLRTHSYSTDKIELMGFSRGGVISKTINKQLKANGDSTLISANPGERILTAAQNANFEKFINSDLLKYGNLYPDIPNVTSKLNLSHISERTPTNIGDVDFHFELPNVTDSKSFLSALQTDKNLQRAVKDLTLGQITGSSSRLSVNSIK